MATFEQLLNPIVHAFFTAIYVPVCAAMCLPCCTKGAFKKKKVLACPAQSHVCASPCACPPVTAHALHMPLRMPPKGQEGRVQDDTDTGLQPAPPWGLHHLGMRGNDSNEQKPTVTDSGFWRLVRPGAEELDGVARKGARFDRSLTVAARGALRRYATLIRDATPRRLRTCQPYPYYMLNYFPKESGI